MKGISSQAHICDEAEEAGGGLHQNLGNVIFGISQEKGALVRDFNPENLLQLLVESNPVADW